VLFHALDAALLFWVLKRATGYDGRSFMVAALFAIHPLNVESVAWIAERKTLLSALFCLLALGAYRWYASKPAAGRYMVVAGLFVMGLMCKPQVIMLPVVLLLWDYWPLQRMFADDRQSSAGTAEVIPGKGFWWLVKEKVPLFFICLVDAAVTLVAQHATGGAQPYSLWIRTENAIVSYARYVEKAFWPSNLALYYPHPGRTLHWWQVGGSVPSLADRHRTSGARPAASLPHCGMVVVPDHASPHDRPGAGGRAGDGRSLRLRVLCRIVPDGLLGRGRLGCRAAYAEGVAAGGQRRGFVGSVGGYVPADRVLEQRCVAMGAFGGGDERELEGRVLGRHGARCGRTAPSCDATLLAGRRD
jgi:hypothetical protein